MSPSHAVVARRRAVPVALAACAGWCAAAASADVTATLEQYSSGAYERVNLTSNASWDASSAVWYFNSGAFQHAFSSADGTGFRGWCTEFNQGIPLGWTGTFGVVGIDGAPLGGRAADATTTVRSALMQDLFARWIDVETRAVAVAGSDRNAASAAFQLLVWEISHENFSTSSLATALPRISLDLGAFRSAASAGTRSWFDTFASSLGSGGWRSAELEVLMNSTAQDQVRLVPAPGVLATLALAGCAGLRRRRR